MRRLPPIIMLLAVGLLAGCGMFSGGKDEATARAERLRQPPDLAATAGEPAAQPAPAAPAGAAGVSEPAEGRLLLEDSYYDAWRRIGLAIDRLGFTLEDRNRAEGRYFVRYDPRADQERREKGFLETLAFWRDEPDRLALYVIQLTQDDGRTAVAVTDEAGEPAPADVAERILTLLHEQLR